MSTLADATEAIKSANAGASWLTFDIVFHNDEIYQKVCTSGVLCPALFGRIYLIDPSMVSVYECDAIRTIKATIPRGAGTGGLNETDFDGTQQYAPLLDISLGFE